MTTTEPEVRAGGDRRPPLLGEELVRRGAITRSDLDAALVRQRRERTKIGRALMTDGVVSRLELYQALAAVWGLPFVDLVGAPPERALLERVEPQTMLRERWVPHRLTGSADGTTTLTVAVVHRPDELFVARVRELFGVDHVECSVTTDWDVEWAVLHGRPAEMLEEASERLALRSPELSARTGWWRWQKAAVVVAAAGLAAGVAGDARRTLIAVLVGVNVMFFVGVVFKLVLGAAGIVKVRREHRADRRRTCGPRIPDADLPVYTILVPAFHEANVIAKIIEHLAALDYPMSKLQILLLMEADDTATIEAARAAHPPECVRFVIVPHGDPQTKPKACNIGLALAQGEYLVIYDAEDLPEPDQLRSVLAQFAACGDDVICLQSRLNYFNARENVLTRMFTLEYSYWFDYMLPGLDAWRLPIPLGGTSNHFRVDKLRDIGGWDPYNVTEDADLGVRAAARGYTVGVNDSTTWEEACSQWRPWIRQRTRWIKGYMVTVLVHTRRPRRLARSVGVRGVVGLVGLVAGTPAMFLACPPLWAFWLYTFLGGSVSGVDVPSWALQAMTFNLVVGNVSMVLLTMFAARRRRSYHLIGFAVLLPLYWVLHSIAAWRALIHLVVRPDHWEKTPHGLVHGPPGTSRT